MNISEETNYDGKESIKNTFAEIIQKHVVTINDGQWRLYVKRALSGSTVGMGVNVKTGVWTDFDSARENILNHTREHFVKTNITDSFEPYFYVKRLFDGAVKIGEIEGHAVCFNSNGFYFYWNLDTEYILESWLTFPAYPYNW